MWGLRELPRAFSSALFCWKLPMGWPRWVDPSGSSWEYIAYIILYDWINFDMIQDGSLYMQRVQIWREIYDIIVWNSIKYWPMVPISFIDNASTFWLMFNFFINFYYMYVTIYKTVYILLLPFFNKTVKKYSLIS